MKTSRSCALNPRYAFGAQIQTHLVYKNHLHKPSKRFALYHLKIIYTTLQKCCWSLLPTLQDKMQSAIARVFRNLREDKPLWWGVRALVVGSGGGAFACLLAKHAVLVYIFEITVIARKCPLHSTLEDFYSSW